MGMIVERDEMVKPQEGNGTQNVDDLRGADSRFGSERAELFEALGHETRIRILQILSETPSGFSELKKRVNIESSGNLSFHLGKLGNLVRTDSNGDYLLTDDGREAVRVIDTSIQCELSRKLGDKVSAWDGYITGKNLELEAGRRIVQSWRSAQFADADADSMITVTLEPVAKGTRINITHSNVPDGHTSYRDGGWQDYYFEPMKAYFSKRS